MENVVFITDPVWSLVHFRRVILRTSGPTEVAAAEGDAHQEKAGKTGLFSATGTTSPGARLTVAWNKFSNQTKLSVDRLAQTSGIASLRPDSTASNVADIAWSATEKDLLERLDMELSLRADLVSEQWLARGPGLLAELARQLDFKPDRPVQCHLVLPIVGGFGEVWGENLVALEAMLFDVTPQFPEVMRVAWLVAACWLDRQSQSNWYVDQPVRLYAAAAEATLRAADAVELTGFYPDSQAAMLRWCGLSDQAPPPNANEK